MGILSTARAVVGVGIFSTARAVVGSATVDGIQSAELSVSAAAIRRNDVPAATNGTGGSNTL